MLGERLRQARLAAGLTLRALGARVGVSATAIGKYEQNLDMPRPAVLWKLSGALQVPAERLLKPVEVTLSVVEFRKRRSLPKRAEDQVKARVQSILENYIDLAELLPACSAPQFDSSVLPLHEIERIDDVELVVDSLRTEWALGMDAIRNVTETVESLGVRVIVLESDRRWDELACVANSKYPTVAIRQLEKGKGDRQRFNILHGLGHLLLCPAPSMDKEKMCHRFAAAMLAPRCVVEQRLGKRRRTLDVGFELRQLKREFGMSIAAWVGRAYDVGVIDEQTRTGLFRQIAARGWQVDEPDDIELEKPLSFEMMVARARAEGIVSPVKAAEYVGAMRRRVRPPLDSTTIPESAIASYIADSGVSEWDAVQDGLDE